MGVGGEGLGRCLFCKRKSVYGCWALNILPGSLDDESEMGGDAKFAKGRHQLGGGGSLLYLAQFYFHFVLTV